MHLQAERILITRRDVADRIAHVAATAPHLLLPGRAADQRSRRSMTTGSVLPIASRAKIAFATGSA